MRCTRVQKFLLLYVSEDLPDNLLESMREHLKSCNKCRQSLQKEKEIQDILASLGEVECSDKLLDNYWEEVLARLRKEKVNKRFPISFRLTRKLLVTNVSIAFIAFIIGMWNVSDMTKRPKSEVTFPSVEYELVMGRTRLDSEIPKTMLFTSDQDKFSTVEELFAEPLDTTSKQVSFLAVTSVSPILKEIVVYR
jgi:hypothetical protein